MDRVKKPQIISIASALPDQCYSQREIYDLLGYKSSRVRSIFEGSGIEKRYLWQFPVEKPWQELCEAYQAGAVELSRRAVIACMDGRPFSDIGCLIFTSCTGYTCPGVSHRLAAVLDMPDNLIHTNLLGMGCEASVPTLSRAVDYVTTHDKLALVVSCEICSCAYFPGLSETSRTR